MADTWGLGILRDMYRKCANCGQDHRALELNKRDIECENEESQRRTDINAGNQPKYEPSSKYKHTRRGGVVKQTVVKWGGKI